MAWKSCSSNRSRILLVWFGFASLSPYPALRADIIDDVNQLNPKKDKKSEPVPVAPPSTVPAPVPTAPLPELEELPRANIPDSKSPPKPASGSGKRGGKKAVDSHRRDAPIHLQSDGTSTYSRNGSVAHLQKNVVITQDDIRLQSDEATILLQEASKEPSKEPSKDGKKDSNRVQSVELVGKVHVARFSKDPSERLTARSDKALFNNTAQVVTLDGNARLWRDGHLIKGDRIVYDIITGLTSVDRAQGVVQPEKSGQ